jgi:diguanylate cyclase (GGDEF)-like protein
MPDGNAEIRERLAALRQDFARQLPDRIAELERIRLGIEGGDVASMRLLHQRAHSLVGSAATFGFDTLSQVARKLERLIKPLATSDGTPDAAVLGKIAESLRQVRSTAGLPPDLSRSMDTDASPGEPRENRLIYLVTVDAALAHQLATQLGHFGYAVQGFDHPATAMAALKEHPPAALIVDTTFSGHSENDGIAAISGLASLPLIFISSQDDFRSRLRSVRAGGCAYFTKPVEIGAIVDTLDTVIDHGQPDSFRVLIVEDSPTQAKGHAHVLEQAGMATRRVTNPFAITATLADFSPELILVDMYMPEVSGEEVATVLRQQEALVSIPIVILSAKDDADKQDMAMGRGADDFLVKPIRPELLVSSVKGRIERYRILRGFMIRDGLTGLLNHTHIKEQLDLELARAKRQQRPLSYAMIDLDFFKRVNDSYGHATGDRVLKSLSRLLRQRLRKVDIIGRYGGEEFAVILPDTEGKDAVRVLDDIRKNLAAISQHKNGTEFAVTFSCGVASFPDFVTPEDLGNAADRALYQAKHEGRNRVVRVSQDNQDKEN